MGVSQFTTLITPTKYDIPDAPQLDITQTQLDTQSGNMASFEAAKKLATDYNDFMRQQIAKSLEAGIPGYKSISDQLAKNFQAQLGGELSLSDAAESQRSSAARALGLGIGGSQAGAALTTRDLGLRQFQIQQNAQAQAPGYLSTMANLTRAPMYDFSNVFLSPMQRAQLSWQNMTAKWNVQNMQNQMKVQPEPWMKALAAFGDTVANAAASYYTGGMLGGGGPSDSGGGGGMFGGGGSGGTFSGLGESTYSPYSLGGYGFGG